MAERFTPHRNPSASSRRSSGHRSNPDVFSDDFALESIAVADGFRPSPLRDDAVTPVRTPSFTIPRRSVASQPPTDPSTPSERRKKVQQGYGRGSSASLRKDTVTSQLPQRTISQRSESARSDATSYQQRPSSMLSGYTLPRTQSVYRGPTGPSHPYGMYPQDTALNRTSTLLSIRPPERAYSGADGPAYPYGMYPQNVVSEGEIDSGTEAAPTAPVGFPGLGQHYTRRLGPEGEEADDIIGADGHTEQLPPYTRFPDAVVTKERYAPGASETQASSSTLLQPMETPPSPVGSQSSDDDHPQINTAAAAAAGLVGEPGSTKERWKSRSKKRTCCGAVPRWALVLIVILSVSLATVLGGVIGHWVSSNKRGGHDNDSPVPASVSPDDSPTTVTVVIPDATPLALPYPILPLLPTGNFTIPLYKPTEDNNACLSTSSQTVAWKCASNDFVGIDVIPSDLGSTQVSVYNGMADQALYLYGAQPPVLKSPASLALVTDINNPSRGPAYFFQQTYDKIVILNSTAFLSQNSKRELAAGENSSPETRDVIMPRDSGMAVPGDQPWFCFWNNTILEGFIYVNETISAASQNTTEFVTSILSMALASPPTLSASPNIQGIQPSSTQSSVQTQQTATETQYNNQMNDVNNNHGGKSGDKDNDGQHDGNERDPHGSPTKVKRDPYWPSTVPTTYPKMIKIEERRNTTNVVQPYCQQMQVLYNLALNPVTGSAIIKLNELESSIQGRGLMRGGGAATSSNRKKREVLSSCSCEWISK